MSDPVRSEVFETNPEAKGQRLDRWLAEHLLDFSRSRVQRLIRDGNVRIDGRAETKCGTQLRAGSRVEVDVPPPVPARPRPEAIALDIVHEDEALIVLNKPVGIVVHPASGNLEGTLVNALLHHCRGLSAIGGVERPGIVHRLDKLTSGLMVVAKNDVAHNHLADQLAQRQMKRTYMALCWGQPQPPAGTIAAPIGRNPRDRKRMAVVSRKGRDAVTHYRTVAATGRLALVELDLETGRTHQIRVHLTHIGFPVVGDEQYGLRGKSLLKRLALLPPELRKKTESASRQMLHAWRLQFVHPTTGDALTFESPLPDDIADLAAAVKEADQSNRR